MRLDINRERRQLMLKHTDSWNVKDKYDLIVLGAGPSGFAAAVSAARQGLRVALIERAGFAGGTGLQCGVPMYYGFGVDGEQVIGGLAEEMVRRLDGENAVSLMLNDYHEMPEYAPIGGRPLNSKIQYVPEVLKVLYNRVLTEAGVDCIFYTALADVYREENEVKAVLLAGLEGTYLLEADIFADCTGDAQLCWLADPESVFTCNTENGMHESLFFNVTGVTPYDMKQNQKIWHDLYEKGLTPEDSWEFFGCSNSLRPGVVQVGMCFAVGNGTDSRDMTRMDMLLRERTLEMVAFLQKYMPGFRSCQLEQTAHRVGVRVSRCIYGEEMLTEDMLFADELHEPVALCWRDFGAHSNNKKFTAAWGKHKDGCGGIPMKSLISSKFRNVLAAGRCISAEIRLSNTIRMMGTCMATGEAAGVLASLAVKEKKPLRDIPYEEVREILLHNGAILA